MVTKTRCKETAEGLMGHALHTCTCSCPVNASKLALLSLSPLPSPAHKEAAAVERHNPLAHKVEQPARRRYEHLDPRR